MASYGRVWGLLFKVEKLLKINVKCKCNGVQRVGVG
jgi:hypothetical protein